MVFHRSGALGFWVFAVPGELQFGAICAISGFFEATFCNFAKSKVVDFGSDPAKGAGGGLEVEAVGAGLLEGFAGFGVVYWSQS